MSEADKIQQLENQLTLFKEETARWFVKYEEVARELHLVREALEPQMVANSQLADQNQMFIKETEGNEIEQLAHFIIHNGQILRVFWEYLQKGIFNAYIELIILG